MTHGGGEIRLRHSSWKSDEPGGAIRRGVGEPRARRPGGMRSSKARAGTEPPPWRARSSNGRLLRCSTRFTRKNETRTSALSLLEQLL